MSGSLWQVAQLPAATGAVMAAPPPAYEDPGVLVLGRISDDPKSHYEQLKPLLDYVVPRMADVGIREGRILMARGRDATDVALTTAFGPTNLVRFDVHTDEVQSAGEKSY